MAIKPNKLVRNILIGLSSIVVVLFFISPYLWLIDASLKDYQEIFLSPPTIIPNRIYLGFYPGVLTGAVIPGVRTQAYVDWPQTWLNTLFVSGSVGLIVTVLTLFAGYAFAKLRIPHKDSLLMLILVTILLPGATMILPVYWLIKTLGLLNSLWGLVVIFPVLSLPFTIWMSISWFRSIPQEIEDSAKIDGASKLQVLTRIILPISKLTLVTTFVFAFLISWNQFILGLVIVGSNPKLYTVPVGLANYIIGYDVYWNEMAAAGVVVSAPLIVMFLLVQRYFIKGLLSGLVKG